ncbi:hypothetical protein BGZ63DRAFT_181626 [Mariannaea sp. PMI_226]|nr:hypothetical protein BGZ63DRAFT_181626 [Mariannaea sp. PMI_226]
MLLRKKKAADSLRPKRSNAGDRRAEQEKDEPMELADAKRGMKARMVETKIKSRNKQGQGEKESTERKLKVLGTLD